MTAVAHRDHHAIRVRPDPGTIHDLEGATGRDPDLARRRDGLALHPHRTLAEQSRGRAPRGRQAELHQ